MDHTTVKIVACRSEVCRSPHRQTWMHCTPCLPGHCHSYWTCWYIPNNTYSCHILSSCMGCAQTTPAGQLIPHIRACASIKQLLWDHTASQIVCLIVTPAASSPFLSFPPCASSVLSSCYPLQSSCSTRHPDCSAASSMYVKATQVSHTCFV